MAQKIILACSVCGARNYSINGKSKPGKRLELKKYCKHCKKITLHKETK